VFHLCIKGTSFLQTGFVKQVEEIKNIYFLGFLFENTPLIFNFWGVTTTQNLDQNTQKVKRALLLISTKTCTHFKWKHLSGMPKQRKHLSQVTEHRNHERTSQR